jgi:septal ring factor EnvC (AmiA/AmiB activator)
MPYVLYHRSQNPKLYDIVNNNRYIAKLNNRQLKPPISMNPEFSSLIRALYPAQSRVNLTSIMALLLLIICCMLFVAPVLANNDLQRTKLAANEEKLSQLLNELDTIKKHLSRDLNRHSRITKSFSDTEINIGKLAVKHRQLNQKQQQLNQQLLQLREEQKNLQRKQVKQQALISEHLRQAYQMGSQSELQVFLEQENPESIDRQLTYLGYINKARHKKIHEYAEIVKQKSHISQRIREQQAELETNQSLLIKQQQSLATLQQKRQQQLKQLTANIKGSEKRIKTLDSDSASLKQLLSEVTKVMAKQSEREAKQKDVEVFAVPSGDFAKAKGRLPWPVNGRQQFQFGKARNGSSINWQGVTLRANAGEAVKAIYAGRVIFADWFQGQGLLMILDHGNGYMSLYGHNESLLQNAGAWVAGGETIATVGNSGGQSIAALYFEIRHNGQPNNPNHWCSKN